MAIELAESLQSVLDLQAAYKPENTPEMKQRGTIVRTAIRALVEPTARSFQYRVQGRDGSGSKNRVPWVRVYDPRWSPEPTDGWYVVYLFAADGSSVFLSLNQGTTDWTNGRSVAKDPGVVARRTQHARMLLNKPNQDLAGLLPEIQLQDPGPLGKGYELGNVYALSYQSKAIPSDEVLLADLNRTLTLLGVLYADSAAEVTVQVPAYLLVWNPKRWSWDNFDEECRLVTEGKPPEMRWSTRNKTIQPNDRVFLIRLGVEPKGIFASGRAVSSPYETDHYSGEPGKKEQSVDIELDVLLNPLTSKILSLETLKRELPDVHWTPEGSGINIPQSALPKLEELWRPYLTNMSGGGTYTIEDALAEVFLERNTLEEIIRLLRRRKNVVLQGPPGVGKTFIAERIAYALLGERDKNRIGWVQFHQSYSYEDFVQGFRPTSTGFALKDGIFFRFCQEASKNKTRDYIFVIDEINRGNLSKIFGEVLSLIEGDKRDTLSLTLAYTDPVRRTENQADDSPTTNNGLFTVPTNVFLLGLMNTADRSLAVVDYALRRRFAFVNLAPRFDDPQFHKQLEERSVSIAIRQKIKNKVQDLNSRISADKRNLGRGFEIGHSFFCPHAAVTDDVSWYRSVIEYEIKPLLQEYWFDDPEKALKEVEGLLRDNSD